MKLPSTSQVLKNLKNARELLTKFDECIKRRTTLCPHKIGSWEQSDIKEVKEMKDIFEQMEDENKKGTSVNTKLSKPSTSRTKLYAVTPLPSSKVLPKVVEQNDLLKPVTSHLTTNKIIEKCTKVLALGLLKIKSELINAYFKNNRAVYQEYLRVTSEYVATLQYLLDQARALNPLDAHIEKWAPAISHEKNNKPYVDASRSKKIVVKDNKKHATKKNTQKTHNTMLPSTRRVSYTNASGPKLKRNTNNESDTICLSCNECLFSANHDACVVKYLNDVQKRKLVKSAKQKVNKEWKPTAIMGYEDIQMGNLFILRVYYVEGLGHNLFSVGQFCDSNIKVAFKKHTYFVRNLEGMDLLTGLGGSNLYTISIVDMMKSSPICLLFKASKTKSLLWHRHLSHLNFDTINRLAKQGLVKGLPKLKYTKDH
ncbi:retrovirus-related pol polyprotein from transposon TNT 1-94 [Tanacetum coccineum]